MKTVKYIGQVLASLVYTPIFTLILYLLVALPFIYLISLPTKWMILALCFVGGVVEMLLVFVKALLLMPYAWIAKNNKCAFGLSLALCVLILLAYIVSAWIRLWDLGGIGIISAVVITGMLLQSIVMSVIFIVDVYSGE
jgi:hypothetical protein